MLCKGSVPIWISILEIKHVLSRTKLGGCHDDINYSSHGHCRKGGEIMFRYRRIYVRAESAGPRSKTETCLSISQRFEEFRLLVSAVYVFEESTTYYTTVYVRSFWYVCLYLATSSPIIKLLKLHRSVRKDLIVLFIVILLVLTRNLLMYYSALFYLISSDVLGYRVILGKILSHRLYEKICACFFLSALEPIVMKLY